MLSLRRNKADAVYWRQNSVDGRADVWAQVEGSPGNGSCRTVHNTGFTIGTPIKAYGMSCVCVTYEGERNSYMTNSEVNTSHENTTVVVWIYDGV